MQLDARKFLEMADKLSVEDRIRIGYEIKAAEKEVADGTSVVGINMTPYFTFYPNGAVEVDFSDTLSVVGYNFKEDGVAKLEDADWRHPQELRDHPARKVIEQEMDDLLEWVDRAFVPGLIAWIQRNGWTSETTPKGR